MIPSRRTNRMFSNGYAVSSFLLFVCHPEERSDEGSQGYNRSSSYCCNCTLIHEILRSAQNDKSGGDLRANTVRPYGVRWMQAVAHTGVRVRCIFLAYAF